WQEANEELQKEKSIDRRDSLSLSTDQPTTTHSFIRPLILSKKKESCFSPSTSHRISRMTTED
ncbi:5906_t:CDS:1, partial [Acaulospora morrowiae]